MSKTEIGAAVRGRPKSAPNELSKAQIKHANAFIAKAFGPSGLLGVPDGELTFAERYLKACFWSKYSSPGLSEITGKKDRTPVERRDAAESKWLRNETRNRVTNERLDSNRVCQWSFGTSLQVLDLAAKYARECIGSRPPRMISGAFTGGASTRVKRGPTAIAEKFEGKAHCSVSAMPYWGPHLFENPGWHNLNPSVGELVEQESSMLFTVPKNSEIDRVACKEPEINMFLQRGLGDFIRYRLKRHGIDLNDQRHNQRLALVGSVERSHATLDLSSASDTVSRAIVQRIIPPAWFSALNDLRVKSVVLTDGSIHSLEMFSSMGNGFTFELETLIFWVLSRAVATLMRCRGKILVYGDDIVVPKAVGLALSRVLPWFGFKLNESKSFWTGPFRESCGGHYYRGYDVTPVFFRERIETMSQAIQLGNQLTRWALTVPIGVTCRYVIETIRMITSLVPPALHGGQSLERTDALVTGDSPRRRLVQVSKPVSSPQCGALIWWYHQKTREAVMPFSPSESAQLGRWVLRPNRSWYERQLMASICHELYCVGDFDALDQMSL